MRWSKNFQYFVVFIKLYLIVALKYLEVLFCTFWIKHLLLFASVDDSSAGHDKFIPEHTQFRLGFCRLAL